LERPFGAIYTARPSADTPKPQPHEARTRVRDPEQGGSRDGKLLPRFKRTFLAEALSMRRLSRIGPIAAIGTLTVVTWRSEADPTDPFQSAPIARPAPKPAYRPPPRIEPEPAIAVSPPAAATLPRVPANYDGSYAGSVQLRPGQSESNRMGT